MKELGIGEVILQMRRRKGITQDELAHYIGVSKASVSKWETGQSYPDITFLPLLASYFSITIDELLHYEPQMGKEDIRVLCKRLSEDFVKLPFDSVYAECRHIIQKYYSCYPLLYAMGTLLLNHSMFAKSTKGHELFEECLMLFQRVREESGNARLAMQATEMEAVCYIALSKPKLALALLEPEFHFRQPATVLISAAQQILEQKEEAIATLQAGVYENLYAMVGVWVALLAAYTDDIPRFDLAAERLRALADLFHLKDLHPGMALNMLAIFAIGYATQGRIPQALEAVEVYWAYAKATAKDLRLHGDAFFDHIDSVLADFEVETTPPRNPAIILHSVIDSIVSTPAFDLLDNEPAFQQIRAEALAMKGVPT